MKRSSKLATIAPVLTQVKRLADKSTLPKVKKWTLFSRISIQIIRQQKLKSLRLFIFHLLHVPILINLVWTIRRLLVDPSFAQTSFLWIPSLSAIDPYYILPALTIGCYYWNLQRFITKENKHTLISRIKSFGQILLILWLPILGNWPAGISVYFLANAIFSIIQTSILASPEFAKRMSPKMILYQFVVRLMENDKAQSQALIESIKTGEESHSHRAITEEELVEQMKDILRKQAQYVSDMQVEKAKRKENDIVNQ
eukprot:TRINITY_DN5133_c0_g1_i2.p1 TRINITY_DN5133_c0_g1~~TRINITY_DN5133_c0_g1_i2.p1  ORF type:complete len:256 (+),score=42.45 TRINITY_DN5133_c0_g1_i2:237-1004(+)